VSDICVCSCGCHSGVAASLLAEKDAALAAAQKQIAKLKERRADDALSIEGLTEMHYEVQDQLAALKALAYARGISSDDIALALARPAKEER